MERACITGMTGYKDEGCSINVQGEQQKKLDVITNDVLKNALRFTGRLSVLASEEEDQPVSVESYETMYKNKRRADVVVEEGSKVRMEVLGCRRRRGLHSSTHSSIGARIYTVRGGVRPAGRLEQRGRLHPRRHHLRHVRDDLARFACRSAAASLTALSLPFPPFSSFESQEETECLLDDDDLNGNVDPQERMARCLMSTLQPGENLVAAGYCLYSSATHLVFTLGAGVNGFTYDPMIGEFVLTHPDMRIPERGQIYSFNEANRWAWDKPLQEYVTAIQLGEGETKKKYSSRYIGSMVGDVHRTLLYGGVFGYPADKKNPDGTYDGGKEEHSLCPAGCSFLCGYSPVSPLPTDPSTRQGSCGCCTRRRPCRFWWSKRAGWRSRARTASWRSSPR